MIGRLIKDCYFHAVDSYWGPCSVDCFASYKNHKIPRFYSKFFNPGSLGVDSLAFSWAGETCWLVPPVSLVKNASISATCAFVSVNEFWWFPIGLQLPFGRFWLNVRGVSDHLFLILFLLRTVKMFIPMGKIIVPFSAQGILVRQCFFFCSMELYSTVSSNICV